MLEEEECWGTNLAVGSLIIAVGLMAVAAFIAAIQYAGANHLLGDW